MKLKSLLIFFLIVLLLLTGIPIFVFVFQLIDTDFDDTWLGRMIDKM